MSPRNTENLQVELCYDHFENVRCGRVCATCPSKPDNEEVVKQLSHLKKNETKDEVQHIVRVEIERINTVMEKVSKSIEAINTSVRDLQYRVVVLETTAKNSSNSKQTLIVVVGLVTSIVIGIVSLIVK